MTTLHHVLNSPAPSILAASRSSSHLDHELAHEEKAEARTPRRYDHGGVRVYPSEFRHDDIVRYSGDLVSKHQRQQDDFGEQLRSREDMLRDRVRAHRGYDHVSCGPETRDKQSVRYVPGERHPRLTHQHEEVLEVVEGRVAHKELGREKEELVERLERVANRIHERQCHERCTDSQYGEDEKIASGRAVQPSIPQRECHATHPPSN